jgi:outer membrane immunogenic protein
MKKSLISATAIALALAAGSAFAADLPSRKEAPVYVPPPPPPPLWTGFYGGLNIGGGWSANTINSNNWAPYTDSVVGGLFIAPSSTAGGSNAGGVVGGGQAGYNFQFGSSIVVGAETDIQGTSMKSGGNNASAFYPGVLPGSVLVPLAPAGNIGIALNWFGTVRGRAGFLIMPTLLAYGTAGFAYGGVQGNVTGYTNTRTGWTAGGGVEWLFMPNWSVKGEYLYVDLDSGGTTGVTGFQWGSHHHPQVNIVRAGLNYHFNFGANAPVLAKY